MLEPHGERLVTTGASWFGVVNHYLGLLAATLGRSDEADARFAEAERTYESLDAQPWLVRLRHDWATSLLVERRGDNRARAPQLMEGAAADLRFSGR